MGNAFGGPIRRDRLHYFAAYENNIQNRASTVTLGRPEFADTVAPSTGQRLGLYEGTFDQPFRSHLAIAKLSYVPGANQTLDLSWNGRFASRRRGAK